MALLILPFLVIGLNMLKRILLALFAKQKLVINREKISFRYQFCCFQHNSPKPTATSGITKIEISNYWRIENSPLEYIIDGSPQIKIGAGRNKYKLDNLSKPELTWLANELSNWLNIPITKN